MKVDINLNKTNNKVSEKTNKTDSNNIIKDILNKVDIKHSNFSSVFISKFMHKNIITAIDDIIKKTEDLEKLKKIKKVLTLLIINLDKIDINARNFEMYKRLLSYNNRKKTKKEQQESLINLKKEWIDMGIKIDVSKRKIFKRKLAQVNTKISKIIKQINENKKN